MKNAPPRAFHVATPSPRIVIPETVYARVPQGAVMLYQEPLGQGNPNWDDHEVATQKVVGPKVFCLLY
jgi:hypothetical protein